MKVIKKKQFLFLSLGEVIFISGLYKWLLRPAPNTQQQMQPRSQEANRGRPEEKIDPLSIEYLRQKDYPGSEIVIEQELPTESNYNRE